MHIRIFSFKCIHASLVHTVIDLLMFCIFFFTQASNEASLQALETLMSEFFSPVTTNERKREIGKHKN